MDAALEVVGAIINRPDLLILDEPFSGLDPVSARVLRDLLAEERMPKSCASRSS